jgi:negative regulator of genetic competence, sporulation and motility
VKKRVKKRVKKEEKRKEKRGKKREKRRKKRKEKKKEEKEEKKEKEERKKRIYSVLCKFIQVFATLERVVLLYDRVFLNTVCIKRISMILSKYFLSR